jgi:hypothetical protein
MLVTEKQVMNGEVQDPVEIGKWKMLRYRQHMAMLLGLRPGCKYQVQVSASNVAGWSKWSKTLVAHTHKAAPAPIFVLQKQGKRSRGVVISGSAHASAHPDSIVTVYAGISLIHIRSSAAPSKPTNLLDSQSFYYTITTSDTGGGSRPAIAETRSSSKYDSLQPVSFLVPGVYMLQVRGTTCFYFFLHILILVTKGFVGIIILQNCSISSDSLYISRYCTTGARESGLFSRGDGKVLSNFSQAGWWQPVFVVLSACYLCHG